MVTYCYDDNDILVCTLRSRKDSELFEKMKEINQHLELRGHKQNNQILDNKSSTASIDYLNNNGITFQFVPPHMHLRNSVEREIRTFKNHFITVLCGVHPDIPLHLWCKLLPQAEMTLNMVRPCRSNPKLSAYSSLEGEFSYKYTPLAPLGAKVIGLDCPTTRQTWEPHG